MSLVIIIVISYIIGSFPTAYLLVKKVTGQDIRKVGSGNIGAMNTIRALKEKPKAEPPSSEAKWGARREMKAKPSATKLAIIGFFVVLIIDMAKGVLSIVLANFFLPFDPLALMIASFFVVLGHNYSVFLKFAGGRGAASLIGIMLYLDIRSFIIWGMPVVLCAILAQIILEKTGFETKINWGKISAIISIFGKQMAGRLVGLILGPLALYFYDPQIFLPIAAGTILLLIKNIPRFKSYFLGERIPE